MMSSTSDSNKSEQLERFIDPNFSHVIEFFSKQYDILFFWLYSIQEYYDFLHEFMCAVKQNYGEKVLVQVCNTPFSIHMGSQCHMNCFIISLHSAFCNWHCSLKILLITMPLSY